MLEPVDTGTARGTSNVSYSVGLGTLCLVSVYYELDRCRTWLFYFFNAALTLGTSSSFSRMLGNGPIGVMANGLICPWLFV